MAPYWCVVNVLVTGQCTLHWGRLEYGNIGNAYIVEPLFAGLRRVFPDANVRTTFQMSDGFLHRHRVESLPRELYFGDPHPGRASAWEELRTAELLAEGRLGASTPYIDEVARADLVLDFSGDMWGDNADLAGADRFEIGLLKDRVAQVLGKRAALIAGSPGPFSRSGLLDLARTTYAGFDLVVNREAVSTRLLTASGFDMGSTVTVACPSVLFEPAPVDEADAALRDAHVDPHTGAAPLVGMTICGWNFAQGPFDRPLRRPKEFAPFIEVARAIADDLGARVCLFSHANGFDPAASRFELLHGRDFPIVAELHRLLTERSSGSGVTLLQGVYPPPLMKAILGRFDMLVTGRVHAAVGALSQCVPTVVIDYGHEPVAHKLRGFADLFGVADAVVSPHDVEAMVRGVTATFRARERIRARLQDVAPEVATASARQFDLIAGLML